MPLTICSLERAVRSSQDVQLLDGLDRWEGQRAGFVTALPTLRAGAVQPHGRPPESAWCATVHRLHLLMENYRNCCRLPAVRSAACRNDRYFLTFSPPGELVSSSNSTTSASSSSSSPSQRQQWQRLGPPLLPWRAAARGAGSVRVCLR